MTDVILVDENDNEIGLKEKFTAHKIPTSKHRAISIIIFNTSRDKTLITQRAKAKPTWPLFWTNTACANNLPGESYQAAADRRLYEELGFNTKLTPQFKFSYEAEMDNKIWGENEIETVFTGVYEGEIKPNPDEVEDYKWISLDILKKDIKKNPDKYTPWFKIILEKLDI